MATIVTWNGSSFTVPETGEENWGGVTKVDGLLVSLAQNGLQKTGGLFTLSADIDWGSAAGHKAVYYKSRGTVATAGILRLAKTESVAWMNNAGSGNNTLATDTSDQLLYNGVVIVGSTGITPVAAGGTGFSSYSTGDILYASGAAVLSKLAIGSASKVMTTNGTAPAWNFIVNANVDAAAAIALSKLAALTATKILVSDGSGFITVSSSSGYIKTTAGAPAYSATIPRADVAAGSLSHVLINDGSGNMSSEATLAKVRGGTAQDNSSLTFPATGTLATLAGTESFSAKTFTDAITTTQIATPSTPSAGTNKLYTKSGSTLVWLDSGGSEHVAMEVAGSHYSLRNFLINGAPDFWQRGTSFATIADGTYTADQWAYFKTATTAVHTVSRDASLVPTLAQSGFVSSWSLKVACTTADAAVAAGDIAYIRQAIEGYDWAQIKNLAVTLTFWVYSTKTGTSCVAFRNNGNDRSYVAEYTISSTLTWEKKTVTLTLNPSGGTDDFTNGAGLKISWPLICGSTFQTTASAWQTGNFHGTSNQVNHCDNTANVFQLAQVQLTIGSTAPSTFNRAGGSVGTEMKLCERYYEKSYAVSTNPGTVTSVGYTLHRGAVTGTDYGKIKFSTRKRAVPTMTYYSDVTGASGKVRDNSTVADITPSDNGVGEASANFTFSTTATNSYSWHWVADAGMS